MSWYGLAIFCAAYLLAVVTPGPGVAAAIAQGLARGSAGAPAFIAGFPVGDLLWFCAAALGLAALVFAPRVGITEGAWQPSGAAVQEHGARLRQAAHTMPSLDAPAVDKLMSATSG